MTLKKKKNYYFLFNKLLTENLIIKINKVKNEQND